MSGTIDEAVTSYSGLSFLGASATLGDTGTDIVLGDFAIGGVTPEGTYVQVGSTIFTIYFNDVGVAASSSATGTLQATLDAEIWSAIGTSGNVTNGFSGQGNVVGSYNIVGAITAVPLPAGLPLLLAGLGGLTGLRLRKMRKARV